MSGRRSTSEADERPDVNSESAPPAARPEPEQGTAGPTDVAPNPALEPDPPVATGPVEREYVVTGEHHVVANHLNGETFRATYPPKTEARLIAAGHIRRTKED